MTSKQAEDFALSLLKPIFAYARKGCATPEDAQDLTQEIILRLLRTLPRINNLQDAKRYCWTAAHNMLSNYYRKKARSGYGIITDDIPDDFDVQSSYERRETEKRLQKQIAYLSKTERQVIIMFYYENMKQKEIADKLGISLSMVKWHLSEAKTNLKRSMDTMRTNSELKFNPISFDIIGNNGSTGTKGHNGNFLRSSLSQNILYAVRTEALTVNEIADFLGVSPVYVESEADYLADNCFLTRTGKKYISNCLIDEPTAEINRLHDETYQRAAKLIAPELFNELSSNVKLGEDGIICPRGDMNFALWALFPYVAALSDEDGISRTVSFEEAATIRPDGAQNICVCSVSPPDTVPPPMYWSSIKNMSGPCWNGNDDFTLWLIDTEWSSRRVDDYGHSIMRDYTLLSNYFSEVELSKDELTHLISRGYLKHEGLPADEIIKLQIVWIKGREAKNRLLNIGNAVITKYRKELEELKEPLIKAVIDSTPPHLKKVQMYGLQHMFHCDGWFIMHCLKNLTDSGKLKLPAKDQQKSLTALAVTAE